MKGTIVCRYTLEAAHYLPRTHVNHKCHRMHGHNWRVEIHVEGEVNPESGWVVDYGVIDNLWNGVVHTTLDHRCLNEVNGLENPTSENVAQWIWARMWKAAGTRTADGSWPVGAGITAVVISENDKYSYIFTGDHSEPVNPGAKTALDREMVGTYDDR